MNLSSPTRTPATEYASRYSRLRTAMAEESLDLLIAYGDCWRTANTRYFTDFRPVDGINGIEQTVILFPLEGEPLMFVDEGCIDAAREVTGFPVQLLTDLPHVHPNSLGVSRSGGIGVAGLTQMPVPLHGMLGVVFGRENLIHSSVLARTKAVKSAWEVDQLRKASQLTDVAMYRLQEIMHSTPRISERDLAREADVAMILAGADGVGYLSMVQAGPRSSFSLALPSNRMIESGDLVLTDIGARYGNYVADAGRGFTVGDVSAEKIDVVEASVSAVEMGLEFARAGVSASDLNQVIQSVLVERGYADYSVEARGRGTGHGTGMDPEEEYPWIGPTNDDLLDEGMVFTLKATINVPEVGGIRTERIVHVTSEGAEPLDTFPMRNHW